VSLLNYIELTIRLHYHSLITWSALLDFTFTPKLLGKEC